MKNLKAPFLVIALLLNVLLMSAEISNPPPAPKSTAKIMNTMAEDDCDPDLPSCNPEFPIDCNIISLVIGGLVLGVTVIYRNQIKKASI